MYLLFLRKYWLEIAIVLVASVLLAYIKQLNDEISSLNKDKLSLQNKLNESDTFLHIQNATIIANQADYNASIAKLPTVLHKIDTKYITKTVEIEKWRDNNETSNDCNASVQYLNSYQF
jgi:GTPase involved in cell partitioning and DNA repair